MNPLELLQKLIGLFSGGAGAAIGGLAANVGALVTLAPLGLWLAHNKDDVFLVLTYGDLAFWGVIGFAFLKVAHYTRPPG